MAARIRIAALLLVLASACHDNQRSVPPTFDRLYYPTGLALKHEPAGCAPGTAGCATRLLVASTNFDLRYDPLNGGTLLDLDVATALTAGPGPAPFAPGAVVGSSIIGSFAGEVKVVDSDSCPGWAAAPQVLVVSRARSSLLQLDLAPDGTLGCTSSLCREIPLSGAFTDPYGVTIACGDLAPALGGAPQPSQLAFVGYLTSTSAAGFVSRIDLSTGNIDTTYGLGAGPSPSTAFDRTRGLLFATERFSTVGYAPLRWIDLAFPQLGAGSVDFGPVVRGAELVLVALSSDTPASRAYVVTRLYDVDAATTSGTRPIGDVGAALLVVDLRALLSGAAPQQALLRVVQLDRGPADVAVVKRTDASGSALRDLVAVTSSDDSSMTLYDDELGQTVQVFTFRGSNPVLDQLVPAPYDLGLPYLGRQPFGLAYEPYTAGGRQLGRLFVSSFDRSWVNAIVFDPLHPVFDQSNPAVSWSRIGPERQ